MTLMMSNVREFMVDSLFSSWLLSEWIRQLRTCIKMPVYPKFLAYSFDSEMQYFQFTGELFAWCTDAFLAVIWDERSFQVLQKYAMLLRNNCVDYSFSLLSFFSFLQQCDLLFKRVNSELRERFTLPAVHSDKQICVNSLSNGGHFI